MTDTFKDPQQFPRLRNLQFAPLKQGEDQYVSLWDGTGMSGEKLIIPMNYFFLLQHCDGEHSLEQLGVLYLKKFGEFLMPDKIQRLIADMDAKLFLEGERVEAAKRAELEAYRALSVRPAVYAGRSYEGDREKLLTQLEGFIRSKEGPEPKPSDNAGKPIKGLVAPHYELKDAGPIYAWAYKELQEAARPDLFVVLGAGHTGFEHPFALTDKDFETPLGRVKTDHAIVAHIKQAAGPICFKDEVAHRHAHAIEFQLPWLQHVMGEKPFTIVPILCAFPPEFAAAPDLRELAHEIEAFLAVLKEALRATGQEACVIASAELAHIGMRYGDREPPTDFSFHRCLQQDMAMLKYVETLDAKGFAEFILKEGDARRITGFAAIYSLLSLIRAEKGQVLRYDRGITDQYNSTATYAAMAFF